jgi:hypothetical protein
MAMTAAGMAAAIKAARIAPAQTADTGVALANSDAVLVAFCQGIINHIIASAELVPISTDHGSAGSGIITGGVK